MKELDPVAHALQVRQEAGRKVVEHADAVATFDERCGDMRADEAGAAGNEKLAHGSLPWVSLAFLQV